MAKVDLKKTTGFAIEWNGTELITQDLTIQQYGNVGVDDIRDQLLNSELSSPEIFYSKYLRLDHENILGEKGIRFNIYAIEPNLAGIEYVKTRAMRIPKYSKIVEVLNGSGVVIMQKLNNNSASDIIVAKVKKEQKIIVPAGYASCIINTRQSLLIVSEVYCEKGKQLSALDDMKGMAYYIIRKNAKQEFVKNPMYKDAPNFRRVKWDKVLAELNITLKTPIIKQILRKYEKFKWLFEESSITL